MHSFRCKGSLFLFSVLNENCSPYIKHTVTTIINLCQCVYIQFDVFVDHATRVQRIVSIFLSPTCLLFALVRVASVLGFVAITQLSYSEEVGVRLLYILHEFSNHGTYDPCLFPCHTCAVDCSVQIPSLLQLTRSPIFPWS